MLLYNDEAFVHITQFHINNILKSVIGSTCSRDNEKNKVFPLKLIDIKINGKNELFTCIKHIP